MANVTKRIYINKNGEEVISHRVRVSNGERDDGSQVIESATFRPDPKKTEKQNDKALAEFVLDFERKVKGGGLLDGDKLTFSEFVKKWFKDYANFALAPATLAQYRILLDSHILPVLGRYKLTQIKPGHINTLLVNLSQSRKDGREGGYSEETVTRVLAVISTVFSTALKWEVIKSNPCDKVTPPKKAKEKKKIHAWTVEEAAAFLAFLDEEYQIKTKAHDRTDDTGKVYHVGEYSQTHKVPTQLKLFFHLAIFCGCRRGELIALEWTDIDFNTGMLSITKSTTISDKVRTDAPKTASSERVLKIPAPVMELVKEWKCEQDKYKNDLGDKWKGKNYVFIQWDGKQMYPSTPTNAFKDILSRYNESHAEKLPVRRLHDLRHTNATILLTSGIDPRTVAGRLGHAQTSTTLNLYADFMKKPDEAAADLLADTIKSK